MVSVDRRSERVMILKLVIDSGLLNILLSKQTLRKLKKSEKSHQTCHKLIKTDLIFKVTNLKLQKTTWGYDRSGCTKMLNIILRPT